MLFTLIKLGSFAPAAGIRRFAPGAPICLTVYGYMIGQARSGLFPPYHRSAAQQRTHELEEQAILDKGSYDSLVVSNGEGGKMKVIHILSMCFPHRLAA